MLSAKVGRPPILPNQGTSHGFAGASLPEHPRFALVGQTDSCDIASADPGCFQCPGHHGGDGLPDLIGIVLHPGRLRIILRQFLSGTADAATRHVVNCGPCAGRTLIDGQDVRGRHDNDPRMSVVRTNPPYLYAIVAFLLRAGNRGPFLPSRGRK